MHHLNSFCLKKCKPFCHHSGPRSRPDVLLSSGDSTTLPRSRQLLRINCWSYKCLQAVIPGYHQNGSLKHTSVQHCSDLSPARKQDARSNGASSSLPRRPKKKLSFHWDRWRLIVRRLTVCSHTCHEYSSRLHKVFHQAFLQPCIMNLLKIHCR